MLELWPVERFLGFDHIRSVGSPIDPPACPVGVKQIRHALRRGHQEPGKRADEVRALRIDQHVSMRAGQAEPALIRGFRRIVHLDDRCRRLLLQPLADVTLAGGRTVSQLPRGRRPVRCQAVIQTQALAQVDALKLDCREGHLAQSPREHLASVAECVAHVASSDRSAAWSRAVLRLAGGDGLAQGVGQGPVGLHRTDVGRHHVA